MSLADRIAAAREALGISQGELARRLDISRPSISAWESGKAEPRRKMVAQIAKILGVSEMYLTHGVTERMDDTPKQSSFTAKMKQSINNFDTIVDDAERFRSSLGLTMPVYAGAEGGMGELIINSEPIDHITRPYTLLHNSDAFGVVVTGSSMEPAYWAGEIAWVNPRQAPAKWDVCVLVGTDEATGERRAMIKEFVRSTPTHWIVRQYADTDAARAHDEIHLPKAAWQAAYKVMGKFCR